MEEGKEGTIEKAAADAQVADDVFGDAFNQAEGKDKPELNEADNPKNVSNEPVEKKEEVKEPVAETKDPVIPGKPAIPDEEVKYEQRYKTLVGIHKHDKAEWENEKSSLIAQFEELKKAPEPGEKLTPKEEKKRDDAIKDLYESLTEDEKAAIKEYDAEFDIVSKMEGKKREIEMARLRAEVDAFKAEMLSKLAPTENFVVDIQRDREIKSKEDHFGSIGQAHPDFETYRDDGSIMKWIESKPKYVQKGMLEAYQKGTAEDVIDLLSDFKQENNLQSAPSNTINFNEKREQKRQALSAVTTKRGAVNPSMAVAEDYDNAFEEALKGK
jgi:hypothetical protein